MSLNSRLKMKTILISGGAGYLGTQLSQYIKEYRVIIFVNFTFHGLK